MRPSINQELIDPDLSFAYGYKPAPANSNDREAITPPVENGSLRNTEMLSCLSQA